MRENASVRLAEVDGETQDTLDTAYYLNDTANSLPRFYKLETCIDRVPYFSYLAKSPV